MRLCRSLTSLITATFACASLCLAGCGHWVSSRDYIKNSSADMNRNGEADEVYGYVPSYDRGLSATPTPEPRYHLPPVVVIPGGGETGMRTPFESSRQHSMYVSDIRNEVNALGRELMRIESRANHKGAGGRAAIEPALRDFTMATQEIARNLDQLDNVPATDLDELKIKTDVALDRARQAVRDAADAVDTAPANDKT